MAAEWMETQRGIVTEDDIDYNRHMSVKAYFPKFDDAAFFLIRSSGLFYGDLHARNVALATVLHKIRYLAELNEGDPYNIESALISIGRRSVRYVQKMNNLRTGNLAASFDTIESLFDFVERKSVPWPDDLRAEVQGRIVDMSEEDKAHFDG